ncbi:penicillin-binding protein 2 [bacterium]|nr:penicillin-binding protein 2 [bacterium]
MDRNGFVTARTNRPRRWRSPGLRAQTYIAFSAFLLGAAFPAAHFFFSGQRSALALWTFLTGLCLCVLYCLVEKENGRRVFSILSLAGAGLILHLYTLQFDPQQADYYRAAVEKQWHSYERPQGRRGNILYRDGTLLAGNRKVARVIAEPELIQDIQNTAAALAPYIDLQQQEILDKLVNERRPGLVLAQGLSLETAQQIDQLGLRGVFTRFYFERCYPSADHGAAMLVGYAGRESFQRLGLERAYDDQLTGEDGLTEYRRDASRRRLPATIKAQPRRDGAELLTTLHPSVQAICEDELRSAIEKNRAEWGCVLVMQPGSGEILGAATYPYFDPNRYASGRREKDDPELNVLLQKVLEPGSTMKPLLAAYAYEQGWISSTDRIICNRLLTIGRYTVREAELDHVLGGNEGVTIDQVISHSSNIGMGRLALQLGQDKVTQAYSELGFWQKTGIELPGELKGLRPNGGRKDLKGDYRAWPKISLANTGFGQGLAVTPLQLASAYCALANGGYRVTPRTVLALREQGSAAEDDTDPGLLADAGSAGNTTPALTGADEELLAAPSAAGEAAQALERILATGTAHAADNNSKSGGLDDDSLHGADRNAPQRVLSAESCAEAKRWLVDAVEHGTGKKARLERYSTAGKTGTAQIPAPGGGYLSGAYAASFVGFFPAEDPRYLVLVLFYRPRGGYYGGEVAAPVFKKVGDRIAFLDEMALVRAWDGK